MTNDIESSFKRVLTDEREVLPAVSGREAGPMSDSSTELEKLTGKPSIKFNEFYLDVEAGRLRGRIHCQHGGAATLEKVKIVNISILRLGYLNKQLF